jgi:hypothetical protein
VGSGRARDVRVDDARLGDRDALVRVEPQDPVEAVEADHDAALDRKRAARQAGPAAARHERDALAMAEADGHDDLLACLGQHDRLGPAAEGGQGVGLVRRDARRLGEQPIGGIELPQPLHQLSDRHPVVLPLETPRPPQDVASILHLCSI